MIEEKVVGTTFAFKEQGMKYYTDFAGTVVDEGTPQLTGVAILMPDPTNKYDPHAVAVVAKLKNGKPFRVGYLARGSQLYESVKENVLARLIILAYSENGDYNDAYTVQVDI